MPNSLSNQNCANIFGIVIFVIIIVFSILFENYSTFCTWVCLVLHKLRVFSDTILSMTIKKNDSKLIFLYLSDNWLLFISNDGLIEMKVKKFWCKLKINVIALIYMPNFTIFNRVIEGKICYQFGYVRRVVGRAVAKCCPHIYS